MLIVICFALLQSKTVDTKYPGWGYAVIVLLICTSVLFVPIVALLRFFGLLKYQKPTSKQGEAGVVAPGSVTPSMSRMPLPPMEVPLAGTREDEDQKWDLNQVNSLFSGVLDKAIILDFFSFLYSAEELVHTGTEFLNLIVYIYIYISLTANSTDNLHLLLLRQSIQKQDEVNPNTSEIIFS